MASLETMQKVLDSSLVFMCDNLQVEDILIDLKSREVLDESDAQIIRHEITDKKRVEKLLEILHRKPLKCYVMFTKVLKTTRRDLYDKMKKEEETLNFNPYSDKEVVEEFTLVDACDIKEKEKLGTGGFGNVYLATHKHWGDVAVKKLHISLTDQIYKEAKKMWQVLACPHLVSIMGFINDPDQLSIVMEYLEFGNLRDFNREYMMKCSCWPRKVKMIQDVSLGMNYLHTRNPPIFHRDLKLQNIFVGDGFRVKIGDFGLAVSETSMQTTSAGKSLAGTCSHMPPEAHKRKYKVNISWDKYTFGITLFEFTSGNDPWGEDAMPGQIIGWVLSGERPDLDELPADVSEEIKDIMIRCWDADQTKRPDFQEIQQDISDIYHSKYREKILVADAEIIKQMGSEQGTRGKQQNTKINKPDAPSRPKVGNQGVKKVGITWSPGQNDGGSPVTGYIIKKRQNTSTWALVDDKVTDTSYSATSDITAGIRYQFQILAVNEEGISKPSDPSDVVVPYDKPSKPGKPVGNITDNKTSIKITWSAPENNGGSPVTGYVIEQCRGSENWVKVNKQKVTELHYTKEDVEAGTQYKFRVYAENVGGCSDPSQPSEVIAVVDKPDAPSRPKVGNEGVKKVGITWSPGQNDGGSPVTGYIIKKRQNTSTWVLVDDKVTDTSYSTSDITAGIRYQFQILAVNEEGISKPSDPSDVVVPYDKPSKPGKPVGNITDNKTSIKITWSAPENNGGSPVTGYVIEQCRGSENWVKVNKQKVTEPSYTTIPLETGTQYQFRVYAENVGGRSEPSQPSEVIAVVGKGAVPKQVVPKQKQRSTDSPKRNLTAADIGEWEKQMVIGKGKLSDPIGIAIHESNGDIAIADFTAKCVFVYNTQGKYRFNLDTTQQLDKPCGVVYTSGKYYVTDQSAYVRYYNADDGKYCGSWLSVEPGHNVGNDKAVLYGICVDTDCNLLVGDVPNLGQRYISKHTGDGKHINSFNVDIDPDFMAVTSHNNVIISGYNVVQIVNQDGLVHRVQCPGMSYPYGICFHSGVLFICDLDSANIFCFTQDATHLTTITIDARQQRDMYGGCKGMAKSNSKLIVSRGDGSMGTARVEVYTRKK
ncbi:uncharacterized protein [Amphiura filiformis]|uniref:uncharacterized protein n=1 Tax=Amphiura filiformis TaxID=82378 RepID=UPI003B21A015